MTQQLGLLDLPVRAPRKRGVRPVSRIVYRELQSTGELVSMQRVFLVTLSAYCEGHPWPPTLAELVQWAAQAGRIPRPDANLLRPRCTEMVKAGRVEMLPARRCQVTGRLAHPARIKSNGVVAY